MQLPAGFPLYQLANQSESKIVIVSAAYRLNLLGFLASDAITADGGSANRGLLDQRAAMEWVQRHISSFGGDPDNVTIDGESAGGASVIMHMLSYGGTHLSTRILASSSRLPSARDEACSVCQGYCAVYRLRTHAN